jgi:hypothetical protein
LHEQAKKIHERARHKLRYYEDYKKNYLDEIEDQAKEIATEAAERIKSFPRLGQPLPTIEVLETLDNLLYIQNLLIELRDFIDEFTQTLRQHEEKSYVKYVTKFAKDLVNDIRYISKIYLLLSLKVTKPPIV